MTDDDASIADVQTPDKDINGSTLEANPIGMTSMATPVEPLNPVTSQTVGRANQNDITQTSPISSALNIAASASSLREDFALCEQVMTEKHQFVVTILDGMNKKVDNIALQINNLEQRVEVIEKNQHIHLAKAQCIFQASNQRQNDLEKQLREGATVMNKAQEHWKNVEKRVTEIEITMKKRAPTSPGVYDKSEESLSIAIYGLPEYFDNVQRNVNQLLIDMGLEHTKCKYAYRTPSRQGRLGVVVAELDNLKDKQEVLRRKRYVRSYPQYSNVFIKTSKTHTEQVMDANFKLMLNEMINGPEYYMSDNGRILRKDRKQYPEQMHNRHDDDKSRQRMYGGARPKTTGTSNHVGTGNFQHGDIRQTHHMQMNQNYIHQKGTPWNYSHREHNQNYDRQDKNLTRNTTHHYSQDGRVSATGPQQHPTNLKNAFI